MAKKAQSISINTIVVAAIALVVMVLLILIATNNLGGFRRQTSDCLQFRGECIDKGEVADYCVSDNYKIVRPDLACYNGKDIDREKVCCVST